MKATIVETFWQINSTQMMLKVNIIFILTQCYMSDINLHERYKIISAILKINKLSMSASIL